METITIKDIEYNLIEKDKMPESRFLDIYNILGLVFPEEKGEDYIVAYNSDKSFNLSYNRYASFKTLSPLNYKEVIDFYDSKDEFHTRLSREFYLKAIKIIELMGFDYEILLNNTKQSPVLFRITNGRTMMGVLVAPRNVELDKGTESDITKYPLGFKKVLQ